jgi:hypothetical protein
MGFEWVCCGVDSEEAHCRGCALRVAICVGTDYESNETSFREFGSAFRCMRTHSGMYAHDARRGNDPGWTGRERDHGHDELISAR